MSTAETTQAAPYRCRACKAPVLWAQNVDTGNTQIVDAEPSAKGNLLVFGTPRGQMCRVIPKDEQEGLDLHTDHHATCRYVGRFRKGKR